MVLRKMKKKILAGILSAAMIVGSLTGGLITVSAAEHPIYASLDPNSAEAITFDGATVSWNGKTWTLGANTIFLDWRLTDAQLAASNGHAFRSIQDAKWGTTLTMGTPETTDDVVIPKGLVNGTEASRMTILTAPGVYWVDNPDDNNIRPLRDASDPETNDTTTMGNATPIGMTLTTNYLYFFGLSSDYSKVVYASARGQQAGANGNFTMFNLTGTGGVWTDNVTFANYTNIDLNFPLNNEAKAWTSANPTLAANILGLKDGGFSRPMRSETRTQAQLFMGANASGRGGISVNSAFMSLHNMLALGQAVMINCYIVAGGHSGNPSIYMNSELHFYMTQFNSGTQFYNSDIYVDPFEVSVNGLAAADTYISGLNDATDVNNAVMVDTRIHRGNTLLKGTSAKPAPQGGFKALFNWAGKGPMNPASRNYQSNVTFDGAPYIVQEAITPGVAINMTGDLLKAYKLESNGKAYYNVKNIIGTTNYTAIAAKIAEAALVERNSNLRQAMYDSLTGGTNYNTIATNATLTRSGSGNLRKGSGANATTTLTAAVATGKTNPGDWEFSAYSYTHEATGINKATSKLITGTDVISLQSTGTNTTTVTANLTGVTDDVNLYVIARSPSLGIARGIPLTVEAEYQATPVLAAGASLLDPVNGVAKVNYTITGFTGTGAQAGLLDRTVVDWFRVNAANPAVRTPVAVSRDGSGPVKDYAVNEGDIGYYLQAEISPKYNHSAVGAKTTLTMTRVITAADVKTHYWTDTIKNGFTATSGKEVIWYDQPLLANIPTAAQNTVTPGTMMMVNGWRNDAKGGSNNSVTWNFSGIEPTGGASGNAGPAAATSRLFYVPPTYSGKFGDMTEEVGLVSSKGGSGFGSSPSFLDIYIKADTLSNPDPNSYMRQNKDNRAYSPGIKNGYGLRIQRMDNADGISKYALEGSNTGGAGAGTNVFLMKFNNGEAYADPASSLGTDFGTKLDQTITDLQTGVTYPKGPRGAMTSIYDGIEGMVDDVRITISMIQKPDDPTKGILTAIVYANDAQDGVTLGGEAYGYMSNIKLEAEVDWNDFGGFGTTYASSTNAPTSLNTANINSAIYTSWRAEAVKVAPVASDATVTSVTVAGVRATVSNTVYNVVLPYDKVLANLKASDIVVTTTDVNTTVGTATTSDGGKTWKVVVTAQDGATKVTYTINVTVGAAPVAPTITTSNLPIGEVGIAYSQMLVATGDTPITWSIASGSLPAGLSLEASTGKISGTPTAVGTASFTVKATNAAGSTTIDLNISISSSSVSNAQLSNMTVNQGTLTFSPSQLNYTVDVPNAVTSLNLAVTKANSYQTLTVSGAVYTTVTGSVYNYAASNLIVGSNPIQITVTAQNGTSNTYTIKVNRAPIIATETPIPVTNVPVTISVPAGVSASIQVTPTGGAGSTVQSTLPLVDVTSTTAQLGIVSLTIPTGTIVSAPAGWTGVINLPQVQVNSSVTMNGTVNAVIEVGSTTQSLTFSRAVRLVIPGMAGKSAGFITPGSTVVSPITTVLNADSQVAGDALPAGGEGRIDSGNDMVIWTKHFTKFVTYTPAPTTPVYTSSSGGGGGLSTNSDYIFISKGGMLTLNGATIIVPAEAVASSFISLKVTVDKLIDTSNLPMDASLKLISDVFEMKTDNDGKFTKLVSVTLPFDIKKVDFDKSAVGIYWLNEVTKKWILLDNIQVDKDKGTVTGAVDHFTKFAVLTTAKPTVPVNPTINFSDISGHWAELNIKQAVSSGIVNGYPDSTFKPEKTVTRAEFAVMLMNTLKPQGEGAALTFTDAAKIGAWAQKAVAQAVQAGIISGYEDGSFRPGDEITRSEMAAMIANALGQSIQATVTTSFADDKDIPTWAKGSVASMKKLGIIEGKGTNEFAPGDKTTRAEAVAVLLKMQAQKSK